MNVINYLKSLRPQLSIDREVAGTAAVACGAILYGVKRWSKGRQVPSSWLSDPNLLLGKNIVITGANTGIGLETAKVLASLQANIIIGCRNLEKGEAALKIIQEQSRKHGGMHDPSFQVLKLDLSDMESVREFAAQVNDQVQDIDVLINNAGVMMCPHSTTKDGFEMQFGTNHLGHFLLTNLLLKKIQQAKGRVINVSSSANFGGRIYWDSHKNDGSKYSTLALYQQSKIANVMFTYELNRRYGGPDGIKTFSLHPGVVRTELSRHFSPIIRFLGAPLFYLMAKSPMDGAQTTIYAALVEDLKSGQYLHECRPTYSDEYSYRQEMWKELWEKSLEYTGLK